MTTLLKRRGSLTSSGLLKRQKGCCCGTTERYRDIVGFIHPHRQHKRDSQPASRVVRSRSASVSHTDKILKFSIPNGESCSFIPESRIPSHRRPPPTPTSSAMMVDIKTVHRYVFHQEKTSCHHYQQYNRKPAAPSYP